MSGREPALVNCWRTSGHARSSGDVTLEREGSEAAHSRDLALMTAYPVAKGATDGGDEHRAGVHLVPVSPHRSTAGQPPSCCCSTRLCYRRNHREGKKAPTPHAAPPSTASAPPTNNCQVSKLLLQKPKRRVQDVLLRGAVRGSILSDNFWVLSACVKELPWLDD